MSTLLCAPEDDSVIGGTVSNLLPRARYSCESISQTKQIDRMGIIGLKRFLQAEKVYVIEDLPFGSHLLIDANGWLFHVIDSPDGLAIQRQLGGSYTAFDNLIRKAYSELIGGGFRISFYLDGRDSRMKVATKNERERDRSDPWMAIYNATRCDDDTLDQTTLNWPPLTKKQFIYTLISLGASLTYCKYEADQQIAIDCMIKNENSTRSYCYGNDT